VSAAGRPRRYTPYYTLLRVDPAVYKSQVQGAENGPEPQFSKSYRIMHKVHDTKLHLARCLAMMSSFSVDQNVII